MDFSLWLAFMAPSTALLLIPGPTVLLVLVYAILADRLRATIRRPGVARWVTRLGGAVLIGLGVATASLRRAAA